MYDCVLDLLHVDLADDVARWTLDVHDHLTAVAAADTARRHALKRPPQPYDLLNKASEQASRTRVTQSCVAAPLPNLSTRGVLCTRRRMCDLSLGWCCL